MTMTAKKGDRRPDTLQAALGYQLRLCRVNAGYGSQTEFAPALGITDSPIAKAESGYLPPSPHVFKDWLDACGVKGQLALAIESMYHLARIKDDPQAYEASSWEALEEQAQLLSYWEMTLFPGPVQTEEYARSLFTAWRHSPEKVEDLTDRRVRRQSVLTRADAPEAVIVLWERVLHTRVGSAEIMAAQLARVLELAELPNVHVHILPGDVQAGLGMSGPVGIASGEAGDAVVAEMSFESAVATDMSHVRQATATFNSVRADALNSSESKAIITEAMEEWKARARSGASPATAAPRPETASS
jgi:hypothetical protein